MKRYILIFIAFLLVSPLPAAAARLVFEVSSITVRPGVQVDIPLVLDTEGKSINAISGTITLPEGFTLTEIRDGDTIVSFWIERPSVGREVAFSGIVPGGYAGANGTLFTLLMEAEREASGRISLREPTVLLNDGTGTRGAVRVVSPLITASLAAPRDILPVPSDTVKPESFVPMVGQDDDLFEGRYFAVFSTQDKQSGIAYYEVAEQRGFPALRLSALPWVRAASPYELADQEQKSRIYVKAVDKEGNARIATISPANGPVLYNYSLLFAILIVFLAAILRSRLRNALAPLFRFRR